MYLTRKRVRAALKNPSQLPSMTNRRWQALKEFAESEVEWARDFAPTQLKPRAWKDFVTWLERCIEQRSK